MCIGGEWRHPAAECILERQQIWSPVFVHRLIRWSSKEISDIPSISCWRLKFWMDSFHSLPEMALEAEMTWAAIFCFKESGFYNGNGSLVVDVERIRMQSLGAGDAGTEDQWNQSLRAEVESSSNAFCLSGKERFSHFNIPRFQAIDGFIFI